MEQYIPKAAVIAEMKNRIDKCNTKKRSCPVNTQVEAICDNKIYAYKELLSLLDTLETKEVDLEKEVRNYIEDNFTSVEEPDNYITTVMQLDDMVSFAKHFFELGLKTQKREKA